MKSTSALTPSPPSATMQLFRQAGFLAPTNSQLAQAEGLTITEFSSRYPSRADFVLHATLADIERQKADHLRLYEHYSAAVERLYGLLNYALIDLTDLNPLYLNELPSFPKVWQTFQDHLASYSSPQLQQLLNEGIRQKLFRSDINIQLVTIILLQQLTMVLTPGVFPAAIPVAEIFRSIFLYYIRGLCTEEGARLAAEHFARI
ncbi:hypothetical protein [Hymenobacter sp. BRD67]|uniref:hypothetical protein n=1 Tax=Hymenobacter sp. BRD67 TaxID=2675877 RepID=UPI00156342DA|nr:hypothetical protein [Hymenobacter sp. BRD67]QKG53892.1 hypothetical protein GKZ67_16395 [Hymenobacter sp. BRD67]